MAGTNKTRQFSALHSPSIILVNPQLPENVGMAARAMMNCGLSDLRIVDPFWIKKGEPLIHEKAVSASSGADSIIQNLKCFDSVESSIADIGFLMATSARKHAMYKEVFEPEPAMKHMRNFFSETNKCAFMFGGEKAGLKGEHIALADALITVPLNPSYSSLNLAQAVLLVSYEWMKSGDKLQEILSEDMTPAPREDLLGFFEHLETELDQSGFLRVKEKRPLMVRNIRNMFSRANLTQQEIDTLRGVITFLTKSDAEKAPHRSLRKKAETDFG